MLTAVQVTYIRTIYGSSNDLLSGNGRKVERSRLEATRERRGFVDSVRNDKGKGAGAAHAILNYFNEMG